MFTTSATPDEPPESVCLLRLSAIGDCCQVVPVIRALQRTWPGIALTWIIGRTEATLLGDLEGVEFITVDKHRGLAAWRALRGALAGRRFDRLLLMQVSLRSGLVSATVRARHRLGFDQARARNGHGLFVDEHIAAHPGAHVLEGFFDFARTLGVGSRELAWDIPIPDAARDRAQAWIPDERPTLVISPCSSQRANNFRNWSAESYARVARHAFERHGLATLLTGGNTDEEKRYSEAIRRLAGDIPLASAIGATNLKELFAVLGRAEAVICPDSGPAHMAIATGTPVIGLYATSNPARTGPYLSLRWTVNRYPDAVRRSLGREPGEIRFGRRIRDPAAMDLITVADVTDRLDALQATPRGERLAPPVLRDRPDDQPPSR